MKKKDKQYIISFIILIVIIFCICGFNAVIEFIKNVFKIAWTVIEIINQFALQIVDDSLLTLLFGGFICFILVGFIFEMFNIPKGFFGKLFGKVFHYLIEYPVSFILNIFSKLIFK